MLISFSDIFEKSFWTSGYKNNAENLYYWDTADGAVPLHLQNFSVWSTGQPDHTGSCIMMLKRYQHRVDDAACGQGGRYAVCERRSTIVQ